MRINERCVSGVDEDDGDVGGDNGTSNQLEVVGGGTASNSQRSSLVASGSARGLGVLCCLISLFHGVSSDTTSSEANVTNATVINNNSTAGNDTTDPEINAFDITVLALVTLLSMFLIGMVLRICYRDGLEGRRGRGNNNDPQDLVVEGEDSDGGGDQEGDVALRVVGGGDDAHESEEGEAAGADNGGGDDQPQLEVVERITSL